MNTYEKQGGEGWHQRVLPECTGRFPFILSLEGKQSLLGSKLGLHADPLAPTNLML